MINVFFGNTVIMLIICYYLSENQLVSNIRMQ